MATANIKPLNILFITPEIAPFVKAGGLGDVAGPLCAALMARGHQVRVVIPRYRTLCVPVDSQEKVLAEMGVWMGDVQEWCSVWRTSTAEKVPLFLIEHKLFFDREGIYHDNALGDYGDNPRRFGFLTQAALQLCRDTAFKPDIVHCNDWPTALAPAYLKLWYDKDPVLCDAASVLTIHNAAYQGIYPSHHISYLGTGWENFTPEKFETFRQLNMLKGGIHYADAVTAVSPSYCRESRAPHGGYGLAPYLNDKGNRFSGILNGADYTVWSPECDTLIPHRFSAADRCGKAVSKRVLQEKFGLSPDDRVPVIGMVTRLNDQKGMGLITRMVDRILKDMEVQLVIVGSGEGYYEHFYYDLPDRFPGKAGSFIGFNNTLAHLVLAGSDLFLMPSLHEPCGLTQLYALRYGTLPIVRATGGLDDTVVNYDEKTGAGTGFKFSDPDPAGLYYTVGWAVSTWYDRKSHFNALIETAMKQRFEWSNSAAEYEQVYRRAIAFKKNHV